ncbi:MAG: hypothetical protein ACREIP_13430 [Alphaproteobacteria bacterium]
MPDPSGDISDASRIMDPSVAWALGPGSRFYFTFGTDTWMPILLRLAMISPADFAAAMGPDGKPFIKNKRRLAWWTESIIVPEFYKRSEPGQGNAEFCTALVPREFFAYFERNRQLRTFVVSITLGLTLRPDSLPPPPKPMPKPRASRKPSRRRGSA